jgi:hypothetical protein
MSKLKKFSELSRREQVLFSEAFFLQVTIGLLLEIIPFKWIPRLFSNPERKAISEKRESFTQIKSAIQLAGRYSHWRNKCLVQSLAARSMLNRRKISSELSLGVAKAENGKMIAHAWLKVGDFEIVEKGADFSELYLF